MNIQKIYDLIKAEVNGETLFTQTQKMLIMSVVLEALSKYQDQTIEQLQVKLATLNAGIDGMNTNKN